MANSPCTTSFHADDQISCYPNHVLPSPSFQLVVVGMKRRMMRMRKAFAVIPLDPDNTLPEYAIWCQISPLSSSPRLDAATLVGSKWSSSVIKGPAKRWAQGSVHFCPAVAYHAPLDSQSKQARNGLNQWCIWHTQPQRSRSLQPFL